MTVGRREVGRPVTPTGEKAQSPVAVPAGTPSSSKRPVVTIGTTDRRL